MTLTGPLYTETTRMADGYISADGTDWYRITDYQEREPFFMSLISADDLWLFISSTGGLTAGRSQADHALFPYYTCDRVTENYPNTGSRTVIRVNDGDSVLLWQPFADYQVNDPQIHRSLLKNSEGNRIIFVEYHEGLSLEFQYSWSSAPDWGWVRSAGIYNSGDRERELEILDGVQNLLPAFISSKLQSGFSNLIDAYKLNELETSSGIALYGLSSRISDRAEANESLMVTSAWQTGLDDPQILLSSSQLNEFISGSIITPEVRVEGARGAFFCNSAFSISPSGARRWMMILEVDQDHAKIMQLVKDSCNDPESLKEAVIADIGRSSSDLRHLAARSDGLQMTSSSMINDHHYTATMFNIMRGGLFLEDYSVSRDDLIAFLDSQDHALVERESAFLITLPKQSDWRTLRETVEQHVREDGEQLLRQLLYAYLPLSFSRRHGDPSRPWNTFSIKLKNEDGSPRLNYEGNWRDIFQNWEPLSFSYPNYLENMITVCLNGITIDGYNPYKVTRDGFAWEIPDPEDPWSNIGYWGDHQVIYLLKLIEAAQSISPNLVGDMLNDSKFFYVNVPYRIKRFEDIMRDPFDTIEFDTELNRKIEQSCEIRGAVSTMLPYRDGDLVTGTMLEKLLLILLVKTTNLIPDGGIWLNTQRPEWNDANNALAGRGLSMVTLYYMIRAVEFLKGIIVGMEDASMNRQVAKFLYQVNAVLEQFLPQLGKGFSPESRYEFISSMGRTGSDYRYDCYEEGIEHTQDTVSLSDISNYLDNLEQYLRTTAEANERPDGLFHAYNVLSVENDTAEVVYLQLMLEGQVSVLSSGMLSCRKAMSLLEKIRGSELYREDQNTYMLYPRVHVKGFLEVNSLADPEIGDSPLISELLKRGDRAFIYRDIHGVARFNGDLSNQNDVRRVLDSLAGDASLKDLIDREYDDMVSLFERAFDHEKFTGRSGRMFAYEGNGSIYWHMVSKFVVAVQEYVIRAFEEGVDEELCRKLVEAYYDVRAGLGFQKDAKTYGAFPMDPYSHTPWQKGARQPGLTGHVKEELLIRMGELGIAFTNGDLRLNPTFLDKNEFLKEKAVFRYVDVDQKDQELPLDPGSMAFTFCQVPVVYHEADGSGMRMLVEYGDGQIRSESSDTIHALDTLSIQRREGRIKRIDFWLHA